MLDNPPAAEFADGVLTLSGDFTALELGTVEQRLASVRGETVRVIDGSRIVALDISGAVLVNSVRGPDTALLNFPPHADRLLGIAVREAEIPERKPPSHRFNLEYTGGAALRAIERFREIAVLCVDIIWWGIHDLFDRSQYRRDSFTEQAFQMGSTALPIVITILFLVGGVSALQSAETLRAFGASVFVADMIAIGFARELAPLLTAIIISGRSGSAIASEIATMKFTEELDALKTMGLNPLRFVVVPKLWAMVVTLPLLDILALGFGIFGGFVVAVTYPQIDLAPSTFISRVMITLMFWDVVTGIIKSISFAVIITVVGTYRGLTFTGGADGVGRATTASVVTAIFAIIVMDSIWGIIFYM